MSKFIQFFLAFAFLNLTIILAPINTANAHNVWCHCPDKDKLKTVEFFHHAGAVYEAFSGAVQIWHESNVPLEKGVLAEFENRAGMDTALRPELFRETLFHLNKLNEQFLILRSRLVAMEKFVGQMEIADGFDETLTKILAEDTSIIRLSQVAARYSDVGGGEAAYRKKATNPKSIVGIRGIIHAQMEDLDILIKVLRDVKKGLRDAIPLAEKGEFAKVMLSGRNMFGDRNPQFTDLFNAYERLYVQSCMATIAATMQVYPNGFEWLEE